MLAIIDYNAGNIQSVLFAMERLGVEATLTKDADTIRKADKVIFPGVGEASTTMQCLRELGLDTLIPTLTQPTLGICLGMQLMCAYSEENDTECLGIFPQHVKRFIPKNNEKVPHIGWNTIGKLGGFLSENLSEESHVYFVHSYYVEMSEHTIATANYVLPFSAAMQRDNFYATQFHPEKSGSIGEQILRNFLSVDSQ